MNPKMFLAMAILAAATGCSKDVTSPMDMMRSAGPAVVTSPADGGTAVRLDAEVTLTFAAPVDAGVVESAFQLFSVRDMADSLCPHATMMPHGGMAEAMGDTARMRHMAGYHATPGQFSWSDGMTRCSFRPDSMMTPVTRFMIHLGPDAMDMMEHRMTGAMMAGHGSGEMSRHMMFHFVTMDTTGGHAGHH
jgi:hypothetical protein